MHMYLLQHHYHRESSTTAASSSISGDNVNEDGDSDYADDQYRLQLRCLMLLLCCCAGNPKLDELLSARHSDLRVIKCDLNIPLAAQIPPMGDPGTGPNSLLLVGFGPDENGKDIVFSAAHHRNPNECCLSALGDLLIYEQNKDPARKRQLAWMANPKAVPPFVFHKPGELTTPLSEEAVRRDLVAALTAVGAPPYVEIFAEGCVAEALKGGCDRHQVTGHLLARPKPTVSSKMLRWLNASDFGVAMEALVKSSIQSTGFKLQSYGNSWPLASLECVQSRDYQKFARKVMRVVNEDQGCTKCGKHRSAGVKLLKCSGCRTTLYCSVDCQKAHWKTHKPDCKRILPSKR
jgi:hypothetical protein